MNTFNKSSLFSFLILFTTFYSCEVTSIADDYFIEESLSATSSNCTGFDYGDSIFYIQEHASVYLEYPMDSLIGTFSAFPHGLIIDETTGAINVNLSETGLRYEVFFVSEGTLDTCKTEVLISGIDYLSGVKNLEDGNNLAVPFYNTQIGVLPSDDDDDEEDDDEDDDDNEFDFNGELQSIGVAIDTLTGVIDLQKTIDNETFGSDPVSGSKIHLNIEYKLTDESNKAVNNIGVVIYYFEDEDEIPQALLDEIAQNNINATSTPNTNARTVIRLRKPRPPAIVIVGSN